jgi:hypothetical protein
VTCILRIAQITQMLRGIRNNAEELSNYHPPQLHTYNFSRGENMITSKENSLARAVVLFPADIVSSQR